MQSDSKAIYQQLLYRVFLLNYTNSVMLSQFMIMNVSWLYGHDICIFSIAVHWCEKLAQHRSVFSSMQTCIKNARIKVVSLQGYLRSFLAWLMDCVARHWEMQKNVRVIICYSRLYYTQLETKCTRSSVVFKTCLLKISFLWDNLSSTVFRQMKLVLHYRKCSDFAFFPAVDRVGNLQQKDIFKIEDN